MAQLGQDFSKIPTSCLDDYVRDTNSIRAGNPVKNYTKILTGSNADMRLQKMCCPHWFQTKI